MRSPLLEQFLTEGRDLIEEASGSLLVLERSPQDVDVINRVFRSVHTLKGNSGLFEYPALTGLLHVAEELMVAVRDASLGLTPDMVDALLAAADAVRTFLDEIDASEALTPESIEEGRKIAAAMEQFPQRRRSRRRRRLHARAAARVGRRDRARGHGKMRWPFAIVPSRPAFFGARTLSVWSLKSPISSGARSIS